MRVGFATALATITNEMLKWLLAHPRPYYVNDDIQAMKASSGLGMPSGHAQGVAAREITPAAGVHRAVNLVLGVPLLVVVVIVGEPVLSGFLGELGSNLLLLLVFPSLAGIAIPKLTSRFFSGDG